MKLRLIIGPAHSGKSTLIRKNFLSCAQENQVLEAEGKENHRVLFVVPEKINLSEQRNLIHEAHQHALMGTDILSFHRIAHHVIEEAGDSQLEVMDEVGKSMMLYRIVCEEADKLKYFSSNIKTSGFLLQLKALFAEFAMYEVDPGKLEQVLEKLDPDSSLYARLSDLILIAKKYEEAIAENGDINEKLLDRLIELIPQTSYIKGARIFVDGFTDFVPQNLLVLSQMMQWADEVTITVELPKDDAAVIYQMTGNESRNEVEKKDLYDSARRTLFDLLDLVRGLKLPLETVYTEDLEIFKRTSHPLSDAQKEIRYLADHFFQYPVSPYQGIKGAVHLTKANGIFSEVERVCRQILTMVRTHGYEYRQIGIAVGEMEEYRQTLRQLAGAYQIPIFMDEKSAAGSQPFIRMILSLLQMVKSRCSYDSFMSFLKTGFCPLTQEQMDHLENMALMHGTRSLPGFIQKIQVVVETSDNKENVEKWLYFLELFFQKVQGNQQLTAKEWCQLLEDYLESISAESLLEKQAFDLRRDGYEQQALQIGQIYSKSMAVMSRIREITGETKMDVQTFHGILSAGFREMKLGRLPGKFDEVIVGELSAASFQELKVLFVLGFSENSFPKIVENNGMLSERERDTISVGFRLAPGSQVQFYDQQLRFYKLISSASDHIFVSYDASVKGGEERRASLYWNRFELILGQSVFQEFPVDPWTLAEPEFDRYLRSPQKEERLTEWFQNHEYGRRMASLDDAQVNYRERLSHDIAKSLHFPENTEYSITRLESYAACPMKHFLQYGLSIHPRDILETGNREDGTILHSVMERAGSLLQQIYSQDDQAIAQRVQEIFERQKEEFAAYQENSRSRYYWRKLQNTAQKALTTLKEQVENGTFRPEHFEWGFGNGKGKALPAVHIPLEQGGSLDIKGVIDRVDLLEQNGVSYIRILDYKSGSKDFKVTDIEDGISLQLPVYLKAVSDGMRKNGKNIRPAGIFYFHLIPKVVGGKEDHKLNLESGEEEKAKIAQEQTRLSGIMSSDPEVYVGMGEKEITKVFPVRFTNKGKPYANETKVRTKEEIEGLCRYTLKKIASMAQEIQNGNIAAMPYEHGQFLSCEFCDFRESCRFDPQDPRAQVRSASKVLAKEFWAQSIFDEEC